MKRQQRQNLLVSSFTAAAVLVSGAVLAQDPPAGQMMNNSYFDQKREQEITTINMLKVDAETFRAAYKEAGRPKLVVLVGQPFSGMISDWQMQRRLSINAQATGTAGTFVPESQSVQVGVENRRYQYSNRSSMLTPDQWAEYERGYQSTLLKYGVRIVNRDVAMRLLDSEIREDTDRNPQDDNQRLEMDMLRKHTKLILEVMPYRENKYQYEPIGYQVTMTSLEDATLLADDRIAIPEAYKEYRAGSGGYSKQRPQNFAGVEAGSGGYDIIENPIEIWAEQGQLAAEATLQILYDRYL